MRSYIRQENKGRGLHHTLYSSNIYILRRQTEGNGKGKSGVPMAKHPTPLQKLHYPEWTGAQGQLVALLSSMHNIYTREIWWMHIQKSLHPILCAAMQDGNPGDEPEQWSTQLSIPHGHSEFLFLIHLQWNHYILQLRHISNWIPKEKTSGKYHRTLNSRSCGRR